MSATATDIETIIERGDTHGPVCHTWDERGYALCGLPRRLTPDASGDYLAGTHTRKQCRSRGHRSCVTCGEMSRQLGDDFMVG